MCFNYLFILLYFVCFITSGCCEGEEIHWIEPDAWSRDHHLSANPLSAEAKTCCPCMQINETDQNHALGTENVKQNTENVANFLYFKKLIILLFHRKHLSYDAESNSFKRLIQLSIAEDKLNKLEQLQDPRDLDSLLTEIFLGLPRTYTHNAQQCNNMMTMDNLRMDAFHLYQQLLHLLNSSEIRFMLLFAFCVACGWILKQRYHIGSFWLTFVSIILYGYLHTYMDCNRELEYNAMLKELEKREEDLAQRSFLQTYILSWFWDYNKPNKLDMLKSSKIMLPYCRPDHVVILYVNDIFLKFADNLLQQGTLSLKFLITILPFPYNLIAAPMLIALLCYTLNLIFKYMVQPSIIRNLKADPAKATAKASPAINDCQRSSSEDRISGENLKTILNTLNKCIDRRVSGVENIHGSKSVFIESKKPAGEDLSSSSDKDHSVNPNGNADVDEKIRSAKPVLIED